MKNLIDKLFRRNKAQENYVIAEYKPDSKVPYKYRVKIDDYEIDLEADHDEMEIDHLYLRN